MIYVVLGMHKSGTTLVSQILHSSRISMGDFDESVSYDKGNKYERQETLALDMDILGVDDFEILDLSPGAAATLTPTQREKMRAIIRDCQAANSDWGFKDPRSALVYNLWAEELPEHRVIVIYRHPAEGWPRFKWKGKRRYHTNFQRAYAYLERWHEHNLNILKFIDSGPAAAICLSYSQLMTTDQEFRRLEEFVGRPLQDRRRKNLYRNRQKMDLFLKVADWFLNWKKGISCRQTLTCLEKRRENQPGATRI